MKQILYCFTLIFFTGLVYCQKNHVLSGYISDVETNETLIGVNVIFSDLKLGTTTNEYGFYSISLPEGTHQLLVSYLGFENYFDDITLTQDLRLDLKLNPETELLDEVIVNENIEKLNLKSPQMSVNTLAV